MGENKEKEVGLEEMFSSVEEVIGRLENPEMTLEESFLLYQNGMQMLKQCNDRIDKVQKQVEVLDENGETHEF
ncbi:MAG: exodeoxyribonuclease VII small subunit [Hespellia sp.]|nr:exodeoxyribonuclease VII small subunit [Hespellia sp.]